MHLLWALQAQLRASPELADCSDIGKYLVTKYLPAVERPLLLEKPVQLIPPKNGRFLEFARAIGLARSAGRCLLSSTPTVTTQRTRAAAGAAATAPTTTRTTTRRRRRCTATRLHKMEMLGIPIPGARDMGDDSD